MQGGNLVTGWCGVLTINAPESIYSNLLCGTEDMETRCCEKLRGTYY